MSNIRKSHFRTSGFLWVLLSLNFISCETLNEISRNMGNNTNQEGVSTGNYACYKTSNFICEIEHEVHRLINQQRVANGKYSLENHHFVAHINRQWNANQHKLGQFELDGLVNKIYEEHQNEFKNNNFTITKGHGCTGVRNINSDTPKTIAQKIVNNWMGRSSPKSNILANGITWQGTGVFVKDGEYLATQILGSGKVNKSNQ